MRFIRWVAGRGWYDAAAQAEREERTEEARRRAIASRIRTERAVETVSRSSSRIAIVRKSAARAGDRLGR